MRARTSHSRFLRSPRVLAAAFALFSLASLALSSRAAADPAPRTRTTVVLVPLGTNSREVNAAVAAALSERLQVAVKMHEPVAMPKEAFYPPRGRYRAEKILAFLDGIADGEPAGTRVLGLTEDDISTTKGKVKDWGVFGLGEIGRRNCVLSLFRLKRGAKGPAHLLRRVTSVATHEVGHTLGLPHCPNAGCVMQDAEGSIKNTDEGDGTLCGNCRATIDRLVPIH